MTIYGDLQMPSAPVDRPYTFINMVATIDGKTVVGEPGEDVVGLGSKTDQELMDRIEAAADAVLIGGQTLRSTSSKWNPKSPIRIGLTRSGDVPFDKKFFTAPEGTAYLAYSESSNVKAPAGIGKILLGETEVDPIALARHLRQSLGIERLHILGGSETNAQFLANDLVDELFLTIAPVIKLGREIPTYAGGEPLPRDQMLRFKLIEHHAVEDEVFLRYRRLS